MTDLVAAARARVERLLAGWGGDDALLRATVATGISEGAAREGLKAELDAWRDAAVLEEVLADELHGLEPERLPKRVLVLAARTLPASAMRQIGWARAIGAEVLLKPASGQEALGRTLAAPDPAIEVLAPLPSGRDAAIAEAIAASDAIVVLGSDATVAEVRRMAPASKAIVAYGHRISAAILRADAPEPTLGALARDCAAWEQRGCLSPQLIWVEGEPRALAERLARHLRPLPLSEAEHHALYVARTRCLMLGIPLIPGSGITLAVEGPSGTPPATLGPGWLTLRPFSEVAVDALSPALSTVGVDPAETDRWREALPPEVRVCPVGEMQRPDLRWRQDGLRPIRSLAGEGADRPPGTVDR